MSGLSNRRIPSPGAPSSPLIEPAHSLIYARLRASLDELDKGEFTEGHELDRKWKVAKRQTADNVSPANYRIFPALLQPFFPDIGVTAKDAGASIQ